MERSREVVLDHVFLIQVSERRMHFLEAFEVLENRFDDLIHRIRIGIRRRDECRADTENFSVRIRTLIRSAGNRGGGIVRVRGNQLIEDRAFDRNQLNVAGCCCFLDIARRVTDREDESVDFVVAQCCGMSYSPEFGH